MSGIHQKLLRRVDRVPLSSDARSVILALALGEGGSLNTNIRRLFANTGTSHLLAVSGLHVGLIAYAVFWALRVLRYRQWRYGITTVVLWAYACLTGLGPPALRAAIMGTILLLSKLIHRKVHLFYLLGLAFIVTLLLQPEDWGKAGFWLSFFSVGSILYLKRFSRRVSAVLFFAAMSVASIYFFDQFSWVAPITNFVAIPWVSLIILPLSLIGVIAVPGLLPFTGMQIKGLIVFLQFFQSGVIYFNPALVFRIPSGAFRTTVFDVGQGLSAMIETAHHTLLYDTGPKRAMHVNIANRVLIPYLQGRYRRLDILMISHPDADHSGGLYALKESKMFNVLLTSTPQRFMPAEKCRSGQSWDWDGVHFKVLYPVEGLYGFDNNSSCVLKVWNVHHSVLLTGDIEKPAERYLISHFSRVLPSEYLLVPHHGSNSSSSNAFIRAVHPRAGWISAGYHNRYHHPRQSVVERYRQAGVKLINTASNGAIIHQFL